MLRHLKLSGNLIKVYHSLPSQVSLLYMTNRNRNHKETSVLMLIRIYISAIFFSLHKRWVCMVDDAKLVTTEYYIEPFQNDRSIWLIFVLLSISSSEPLLGKKMKLVNLTSWKKVGKCSLPNCAVKCYAFCIATDCSL